MAAELDTLRVPDEVPGRPAEVLLADARPDDRDRVARRLLAAGAGIFIAAYVAVALRRLGHPYELEWMEGGVVDHVRRVLDGRALYGPPSLDFVPYIYTPLYYYVGAGVSAVLGVGFLPLRLISFASSLVAFWALHRLVTHETGDRWAGFVAAGVLAGTYRLGGDWFDLARVDSLFLALLLTGLLLARTARSVRTVVAAGVLVSLAFLTKQAALLPAVAPLLWLAVTNRRWAAAYGATVAGGIGGTTVLLDLLTDGWYSAYVLDLPRSHELVSSVWVSFWTTDLLARVPLAIVLGGAAVLVLHRRRGLGSSVLFFVPVAGALVASAYSSRLHSGGFDNVLIPAYAAAAIGVGLGLAAARRATPGWRTAGYVAAGLQLVMLLYAPWTAVPDGAHARSGQALIADLGRLPGPVYLPGHGWYLAEAGHQTSAQGAAIKDVLRSPLPWRRPLDRELRRALAEQRFAAVVVDSGSGYSYLPSNFEDNYRFMRLVDGGVLLPLTGTRTGPAEVWVPRQRGP